MIRTDRQREITLLTEAVWQRFIGSPDTVTTTVVSVHLKYVEGKSRITARLTVTTSVPVSATMVTVGRGS